MISWVSDCGRPEPCRRRAEGSRMGEPKRNRTVVRTPGRWRARLDSNQRPRLEEARLPAPRRFSEENLDSEQETRERDVGRGSSLHSEGCGSVCRSVSVTSIPIRLFSRALPLLPDAASRDEPQAREQRGDKADMQRDVERRAWTDAYDDCENPD